MTDEINIGKALERFVEVFESVIVFLVLKMEQDGNLVFVGQLEDANHRRRVAGEIEFQFADSHGPSLEPGFHDLGGVLFVGNFVAKVDERFRMFLSELSGSLGGGNPSSQTVGATQMS